MQLNMLKNKFEALILASIIEKEAGNHLEKKDIAGVFLKRISLGMKLQADPTIIYGLLPNFDGDIKKTDMKRGYKRYKELSKEKNFNLNTIPFTTEEFLIDYFEKLNISERILEYAKHISKNVIKIKNAKTYLFDCISHGLGRYPRRMPLHCRIME